jgi:polysaccharide export outer membrane protein
MGSAAHAQPASAPRSGSAAPAASTPAPAEAPAVAVDANFQLGIGDQVSVEQVGRNDPETHATVGGDGKIVIPLIGEVKALGLTTDQLAVAIQDGMKKGGFYTNPVVHVSVIGVASRYVAVLGDVGQPGLLPLDRTYHLSDIVARVAAKAGEGIGTIVLTHANGESKKYTLEDIATGGSEGDPLLQGGDKIYVPSAASELVYISGQVHSPGAFPLTKNMTIRDAIARGGGLTEMGSEKKLKLFRKNVLVKDPKVDTPLQAGDILQIGEKLF